MSDSPLRVALTEVKEEGEKAVKVSVPADLFPDALSEGALVGEVAVDGMVRRVEDDAVFEGTASGRWRFECTRCLAPVERSWSEPVEMTASIDAGPMDLTDEVRQSIGLAQPMKMVCKPDCKGLCPVCRKDLNQGECGHNARVAPADDARTTKPRLIPPRKKG